MDGEARENFRMRIENTLFVQLLVGAKPEREGINAKLFKPHGADHTRGGAGRLAAVFRDQVPALPQRMDLLAASRFAVCRTRSGVDLMAGLSKWLGHYLMAEVEELSLNLGDGRGQAAAA